MKTYLITLRAVAISDAPPNPLAIDISSPDFPTILETRIVEMVPKTEDNDEPTEQPEPETVARPELQPTDATIEDVSATSQPRELSGPRYGSRGNSRRSRMRSGSIIQEKLYTGNGYVHAATEIGVGEHDLNGVWLTESERRKVCENHSKRLERGSWR